MGWASGSAILSNVWSTVRDDVPEVLRVERLSELMDLFENEDCDTTNELIGEFPEAEEAYYTLHPDYRESTDFDSAG